MENKTYAPPATPLTKVPLAAAGKRRLLLLLTLLMLVRILHVAVEVYASTKVRGFDFEATNLRALALLFFFVFALYKGKGEKAVPILAILGAGFMLWQAIDGDYFTLIFGAKYNSILRLYAALFVLAGMTQLVVMLFVLFDPTIQAHFRKNEEIPPLPPPPSLPAKEQPAGQPGEPQTSSLAVEQVQSENTAVPLSSPDPESTLPPPSAAQQKDALDTHPSMPTSPADEAEK